MAAGGGRGSGPATSTGFKEGEEPGTKSQLQKNTTQRRDEHKSGGLRENRDRQHRGERSASEIEQAGGRAAPGQTAEDLASH